MPAAIELSVKRSRFIFQIYLTPIPLCDTVVFLSSVIRNCNNSLQKSYTYKWKQVGGAGLELHPPFPP